MAKQKPKPKPMVKLMQMQGHQASIRVGPNRPVRPGPSSKAAIARDKANHPKTVPTRFGKKGKPVPISSARLNAAKRGQGKVYEDNSYRAKAPAPKGRPNPRAR